MLQISHLKKWKKLFVTPQHNDESYYDLFEDWDLIDASVTQQYGIRLRYEPEMQWGEFCALLTGLNGDTPLGHVVDVRSTTDKERIKNMSASDKRIRAEWQARQSKKPIDSKSYMQSMRALEEAMKALAS